MDPGARNLLVLVAAVWCGLFAFYGLLGYRARLWSPSWVVTATERLALPAARPGGHDEEPPIGRGRLLYRRFSCGVCHGPNGEGGVKNPNADPDGAVPNVYDLADAFTSQDLKDRLRKGSRPARLEEGGPEPPLGMPAWGGLLSDGEVEDLARYLFSLKDPAGSRQQEPGGT